MKIRLKLKDRVLTATLKDNKTAQDFVSLLPLTLTMNDLFGREKFSHLPRAISGNGEPTHRYEVGQIVYWSPGPDMAIFYRNDGEQIPAQRFFGDTGFQGCLFRKNPLSTARSREQPVGR
jgi:hypothetical protein